MSATVITSATALTLGLIAALLGAHLDPVLTALALLAVWVTNHLATRHA